jgi:hypothetical protein
VCDDFSTVCDEVCDKIAAPFAVPDTKFIFKTKNSGMQAQIPEFLFKDKKA